MGYLLLLLGWITALVSSETECLDGYFTSYNGTHQTNECMFRCYSTDTFISSPKTELTWESIVESCSGVETGLRLGYCANRAKTDLVWPDSCDCPYCKCDTQDIAPTGETFERPISKRCYSCMCDTVSGTTDLGYQCSEQYHVEQTYNWADFICPATSTCTDPIPTNDQHEYYPGQGYFKNQDADEVCNEYCYCGADDATPTCATGFNNILSSTNTGLKGSFLDDNSYSIRDCIDDPVRIFTTDVGTYCDGWPLGCTCPTGKNVGDTWYTESDSGNLCEGSGYSCGGYSCQKCECKAASTGNGQYDYVDCGDDIGSHPVPENCIAANVQTRTCHSGYGGESYGDAKVDSNRTLNEEVCDTTAPLALCSWNFEEESDDTDYWNWGCDNIICGIYGTNHNNIFSTSQCSYSQYSVPYTDCYGNSKTHSGKEYTWCCNTDNCNLNEDIVTSNCNENTQLSEVIQSFYECSAAVSGNSIFDDDDCDNYAQETIGCSSIKELYKDQARCYCIAYSGLYSDANGYWQEWIRDQIDMMFDSFSEWNDVFDCDIELTCDLWLGEIGGADCNEAGWMTGVECESGWICLSDGSCVMPIDTENTCASDRDCNTDYTCQTSGGFCYFSQCSNDGQCAQYGSVSECVTEIKTYSNVQYTTGSCIGSTASDPDGVQRYGVFAAIFIVFATTLRM